MEVQQQCESTATLSLFLCRQLFRDVGTTTRKGSIEGFVDLGGLGEESSGGELADHGLAVVFQPFTGQWMQILGVFASRGNVKAAALSKVVLEATLLCEQAGLFVDGVTCDAASWNRSMWKLFGIRGSSASIKCKCLHPADERRFLHFFFRLPAFDEKRTQWLSRDRLRYTEG
ncbi:uncharacterized protein LOC144154935 isoform X2 [Haemaphysalis longicornis]